MKRKLLAAIAAVAAALCASLAACGGKSEVLQFTQDGINCGISGTRKGSATKMEIPSEHDGKVVTSIGKYAFDSCGSLEEIYIPESVRKIGAGAFYCCRSLSSITVPEGVEAIGEWTFGGCFSLRSVYLPSSVNELGANSFRYCKNLNEINYGGTVEQWIGLEKGASWNYGAGAFVVNCADGKLRK